MRAGLPQNYGGKQYKYLNDNNNKMIFASVSIFTYRWFICGFNPPRKDISLSSA